MSDKTHQDAPVERAADLDVGDYDADDPVDLEDEFDDGFDDEPDELDNVHEDFVDEESMTLEEQRPQGRGTGVPSAGRSARRYRPGRGGFDPEAAEIAAKAKYAYRQRVVLSLIAVVIITAVAAVFLWSSLWWANGAAGVTLVGYLAYLRRQVRIEEEIRQRRLARMNAIARDRRGMAEFESHEEIEVAEYRREIVGAERKPVPTSRIRRQAVVLDLDDEDPAFHELNDPGQLPFRRAVGE